MPAQKSLQDLASIISNATKQLEHAGFDPSAAEKTAAIADAQSALLQAAREMTIRVQSPMETILSFAATEYDLAALHIVHRFDIAKLVPAPGHGDVSTADIAAHTGLSALNVRRILRHAVTFGLFTEPAPDRFAATPLSTGLATDPAVHALAGLVLDEQLPAAARLADAWELAARASSPTPSPSAWNLANGTDDPMMQVLATQHPRRAAQLSDVMTHVWSKQQPLQPLLDNVDWAALGAARVVDVGGGLGQAGLALAGAFPTLSVTVQDLPEVVARGEAECPGELASRVRFEAHDLFAVQTVRDAAVYVLRSVLHDWSDEDVVKILKALGEGLRDGARVLVCESVVPVPGEMSVIEERAARCVDLSMAAMFNSREREGGEWEGLFKRASTRYRFEGVRRPVVNRTSVKTERLLCFIEATWMAG